MAEPLLIRYPAIRMLPFTGTINAQKDVSIFFPDNNHFADYAESFLGLDFHHDHSVFQNSKPKEYLPEI
jgi:hypothetical protein